MRPVVVLGAGMVGSAMAIDLCDHYQVTLTDIDTKKLNGLKNHNGIHTKKADLSDKSVLKEIIKKADLVINAVPGYMGFQTLKTVIQAGKDIVDISFFSEDPFELDALAKKHKVTAIVDCGVAPGMSHMILGYHSVQMEIEYFECLVGGLPFKRIWPYFYKAPFSPIDVIEEYTRPARLVENGKIVIKPALSDLEQVNINPVGTLEAFNTDGLRTLLKTMKIPTMIEKTLRYPGHIEAIQILKQTGFLNRDKIEIGGIKISPIELTSRLLFPLWQFEKNEREFTVMQVTMRGQHKGKTKTFVYHLYDEFDRETQTSSMARTTGYTCTAAARLVLEGAYRQIGISPPEYLGMNKICFNRIAAYLESRKVTYNIEEKISPNP